MPKENKFEVEYSKSNMATCRVCMAKIPKGTLRIGHSQVDLDNDAPEPSTDEGRRYAILAGVTRWHHFECFPRMKGGKWMEKNVPHRPDGFIGWDEIKMADRKRVVGLWNAMARSTKAGTPAGGKRKADEDAGSAKGKGAKNTKTGDDKALARQKRKKAMSKFTSPRGVLSVNDHKKIQALESELDSATIGQLRAELYANKQTRAGKKDELVQRVAECRVLGGLPACPKCEKGQIHWSRIGGWYSCPGYYDNESRTQKRCNFRTQSLKRLKWKRTK